MKKRYNNYQDNSEKILIVCTGNTCRSPMAEEYMRSVAPHTWIINSAGTKAESGDAATSLAISVASKHGLDLSDHESQLITQEMIDQADIILVMERRHLELLPPSARSKARLLDPDGDIVDPYGGDREAYEKAYRQIEKAIDKFIKDKTSPYGY